MISDKLDQIELAEVIADYADNPLAYVMDVFPWGIKGTDLAGATGPDKWQMEALRQVGEEVRRRRFNGYKSVEPIRFTRASGHSVGKTTLAAWLVCWIKDTRPDSQGTVTANTFTQLETKTWAAIQKWAKLAATREWWEIGQNKMYHRDKDKRETWFVACQSSSEENSEAFAGQHAATSTSYYIFDESSAIPDEIWRVAEGGLVDGEPMIFCFGNPTRNTGQFYEANFGKARHRWNHGSIDSRDSGLANQATIQQWIDDYGLDSDFVKVRVRGLPPSANELQFIDWQRIRDAQKRDVMTFSDEPLIAGVDCADGGAAWNICWFRRGYDARSIPPIAIPGGMTRNDPHVLTSRLAEALRDPRPERRIAAMFIDAAFGAHIAERLRTMGFSQVHTVRFGAQSSDPDCLNWRAMMYKSAKDWLLLGAIPTDESDKFLASDLSGPGYHLNSSMKLVIESKQDMAKRRVKSPDRADAFCFEAGTLIRTPHGERRIESIQDGDLVVTPFGSSPVEVCHSHRVDSLTKVRFSNGASLVGTAGHKIFTFSSGKKRLDALALTDDVEVYSRWRLLLWRFVSLSFIGVRSFGFKRVVDTFSPAERTLRRDFFIVGCGLTISGLFQKVSKFITRTMTGATTILETMSCGRPAPIIGITCSSGSPIQRTSPRTWSILNAPARRPLNGMVHLKALSGTASTESRLGTAELPLTSSVPGAEPFSRPSSQQRRSSAPKVARNVDATPDRRRNLRSVHSAVRTFWRTVTGLSSVVPVSVQTENVPPTLVYNLTLREHNAYYANGVLVFNCLTFAQPVAPVQRDDDYDRDQRGQRRSGADAWMIS